MTAGAAREERRRMMENNEMERAAEEAEREAEHQAILEAERREYEKARDAALAAAEAPVPEEDVADVIPSAREYLLKEVADLAERAKAIVDDAGWGGLTPEQDAQVKTLIGTMVDFKAQAEALQEGTKR